MVRIVRLSPSFAVAGQLTAADFAELAAQGIKSVIGNRPDGEHPDQLSAAESEKLAKEHGMAFRYMPLVMADVLEPRTAAATQAAIDSLPAPVLAFCRSGTRSAMAWANTASQTQPVEAVVASLKAADFEIPGLEDALRGLRG